MVLAARRVPFSPRRVSQQFPIYALHNQTLPAKVNTTTSSLGGF